jgi:glucose-6-phosphate 1-dehydrogenase
VKQTYLITIFGSTGDLTARKLLPALTELIIKSYDIHVIAVGRRLFTDADYLTYMNEKTSQPLNQSILKDRLHYIEMDIHDPFAYLRLKDKQRPFLNGKTKRLYYMAVGPELFGVITDGLNHAHLVKKDDVSDVVAFEKPFGEDLLSAEKINALLSKHFSERQMFRIDHYLGKEMIQNIMMLRFANRIIEDSWHNRSIKKMSVYVKEKDGILSRAGYYDKVGALRDMMQSHVLQVVSLLTMDIPVSYYSDDVKNEKVAALQALTIDDSETVLGQYQGYLQEENVLKNSTTETFVFLKGFMNTPRFKGVPIYMVTGKMLDEKNAFIEVEFEETSEQRKWHLPLSTNRLRINIAPEDGFQLTLNAKVPGLREGVQQVKLGYDVDNLGVGNLPEAYEKLFLDMMEHHRTLFTRWDEIQASWEIIDSVLKQEKHIVTYQNYEELKQYIKEKTGETLL